MWLLNFVGFFWHISYEKCDKAILLQSVAGCYYKLRQILQSVKVITKWDVTVLAERKFCVVKFTKLSIIPTHNIWIKFLNLKKVYKLNLGVPKWNQGTFGEKNLKSFGDLCLYEGLIFGTACLKIKLVVYNTIVFDKVFENTFVKSPSKIWNKYAICNFLCVRFLSTRNSQSIV